MVFATAIPLCSEITEVLANATQTNPSLSQDSEENLTGLSLQSMVIQEVFRNVILEEEMCGILRWQIQFIEQKPISFGLFQEVVNNFYLPDLKPVLKRKQSMLSMYLNGIAACCFCFVFFIQSNAQQGILGLEDGWTADFNKSEQLNCQRSS